MNRKKEKKVDLTAEGEGLRHSANGLSRKGWNEALRELHENKDDRLLMDDVFDDEKFEEWENED